MTDAEKETIRRMNAEGCCDWQIADALFYSKLTKKETGQGWTTLRWKI